MLVDRAAIDDARERIADHVLRTPTIESDGLSELLGCDVYCKAELLQRTGSFKVRGVFNKVLSLSPEERVRGLIAFSAGNHAMAVAHVGAHLDVGVTVVMPAGAVQFKVDAVRAMGADLDLVEGDVVAHLAQRQEELGATPIHPFADPAIIAGHASAGLEIHEDVPDVDTVIVPVGGGGLISAVATALKSVRPDVRVIGVEPDTAAVIHHSIKAGGEAMSIPWPKSLADGLNSPSSNELNLAHIDAYVDEMVLIPEASIGPAWRELLTVGKFAGEPAAAVGIAAIQCGAVTVSPDEKVCLILSGGNADLDQLAG